MKYQKEFDELISLATEGLGESDKDLVKSLVFMEVGGPDQFDKHIDIGIANGYSIEQQMEIAKKVIGIMS